MEKIVQTENCKVGAFKDKKIKQSLLENNELTSDSNGIAARGNHTGRPCLASNRRERTDAGSTTGFSQMS